jgi:hypothetical protein
MNSVLAVEILSEPANVGKEALVRVDYYANSNANTPNRTHFALHSPHTTPTVCYLIQRVFVSDIVLHWGNYH